MNRAMTLASAKAAVLLVGTAGPSLAHHSRAMFDQTKPIELKGQATKFEWANPHCYLEMDVADARGGTQHYVLELNSPSMLARVGWRSSTVKPGDKVTATIAPFRDGTKGAGLLTKIVLPDGSSPTLGLVQHPVSAE